MVFYKHLSYHRRLLEKRAFLCSGGQTKEEACHVAAKKIWKRNALPQGSNIFVALHLSYTFGHDLYISQVYYQSGKQISD